MSTQWPPLNQPARSWIGWHGLTGGGCRIGNRRTGVRLRAQAKSSIHADMTMVGTRAVNPLKAAWDVDVALRHLLAPERADLMSPVQAVSDAYDDLRAHDRGRANAPRRAARARTSPDSSRTSGPGPPFPRTT